MHIRQATADDLDTVVRFNHALALESEGKPLDRGVLTEGVRKALSDPQRCVYFLAEIEGTVVAQIMFTTEWSDWRSGFFWWIQSVYVDPAYRRRGVFRMLYNHVRARATERPDVCGLRLYVHHDNAGAIDTYRNLGMTQTEYLLCEEEWPSRSEPASSTPPQLS
ncbi:MAG: GNAT family N-acetyltransferase [Planctomycetes bacterium]|nr:GNAT family N-acetyltransferase [Planctomycetota bacterium]